MPKQIKIKRYRRMYRRYHSPSSLLIKGAGILLAICVLAFIGWSAYGPIMDFLSGEPLSKPNEPAASSAAAAPPVEEPEPEPEPVPAMPAQIQAVYAPVSALSSLEALDAFLDKITFTGVNALLFDLKDSNGNILYRSGLERVSQTGAQVSGAYDLAAVCSHLVSKNIAPIGRMQAFRDPVAASALTGAGVTYMNSEMLWLDNARESGGKPWLNPYSDTARAYLYEIAEEAVSMGVKQVLLDNVNFPVAFGGLELATYGEKAATESRPAALASFVQEMSARLTPRGADVSVYLSGISALGLNDVYYGGSPFDVSGDNLTIGAMPAQFGDSFILDDFSVSAPILAPGETVRSLMQALSQNLSGKQVTALIQGYTSTASLTNNKAYLAEDITAQISALTASGIPNYVVYSPDGNYPG
ncbi:putative glycoside hydrolase [Anaerotruncus rubiinfantis]|uniref:putative glycoside hydrolase n=1 Tax=Anaerotruncus rubiinfantis TaxID=1720200 RepID=UPI0034A248D5